MGKDKITSEEFGGSFFKSCTDPFDDMLKCLQKMFEKGEITKEDLLKKVDELAAGLEKKIKKEE